MGRRRDRSGVAQSPWFRREKITSRGSFQNGGFVIYPAVSPFRSILGGSIAAALLLHAPHALAQFNPGPNPIETTVTGLRTLSSGTGQITVTGRINATGEDAIRPISGTTVENAGILSATPTGTTSPSGSDGIDLRTQNINVIITNTGTISGRHGIATDGNNIGPSSVTVNNNAGTISALNGSGLNIDGVNTSVTANVINLSGATIQGGVLASAAAGDGDGIDVDGVLTLSNSGNVFGFGAKGSNNPEGIAAGGGTITNFASGQIIGSSSAMDAPNGDTTKLGSGILIDNSNGGNAVAATTVTNSGLIHGRTGFGIRFIGNRADIITNNAGGTIRGAGTFAFAGAAIQTGDGADTVTNRGAITGDNGTALDLEAGNDILTIEGNAATITGNISGGTGTNTLNFDLTGANTFNYAGAISNFSTVEVKSGRTTLSGVSSFAATVTLTGGTLLLDGSNRLASGNVLNLNGGTLALASGGASAQTFTSLTLSNSSTLDLDDATSITFGGLAAFTAGRTLQVIDYAPAISPSYALRFAGNQTANATFLSFASATTIDGQPAGISFDGTFTNLVPVPEPATIFGATLLLALIAWRERRRLFTQAQA